MLFQLDLPIMLGQNHKRVAEEFSSQIQTGDTNSTVSFRKDESAEIK